MNYNINKMNDFYCKLCNYKTTHKGTYNRHINSKKHKKRSEKLNETSENSIINLDNLCKNDNGYPKSYPKGYPKIKNLEKIEKIYKNQKIENCVKDENLHFCNYCNKAFKYKSGKSKHINELRCKNIPTKEIVKIIDNCNNKRINKIINQNNNNSDIDLSRDKDKNNDKDKNKNKNVVVNFIVNNNIVENQNIENNYTNNIKIDKINNIVINSIGQEKYDHITDEEFYKICKSPYSAVSHIVKKIHIDRKENRNVIIPNINSKNIIVMSKNNKWEYQNKKKIFTIIADKSWHILHEHLADKYEENPDEVFKKVGGLHIKNITKINNKLMNNDAKIKKDFTEQCEYVFLNNRDKLYKLKN